MFSLFYHFCLVPVLLVGFAPPLFAHLCILFLCFCISLIIFQIAFSRVSGLYCCIFFLLVHPLFPCLFLLPAPYVGPCVSVVRAPVPFFFVFLLSCLSCSSSGAFFFFRVVLVLSCCLSFASSFYPSLDSFVSPLLVWIFVFIRLLLRRVCGSRRYLFVVFFASLFSSSHCVCICIPLSRMAFFCVWSFLVCPPFLAFSSLGFLLFRVSPRRVPGVIFIFPRRRFSPPSVFSLQFLFCSCSSFCSPCFHLSCVIFLCFFFSSSYSCCCTLRNVFSGVFFSLSPPFAFSGLFSLSVPIPSLSPLFISSISIPRISPVFPPFASSLAMRLFWPRGLFLRSTFSSASLLNLFPCSTCDRFLVLVLFFIFIIFLLVYFTVYQVVSFSISSSRFPGYIFTILSASPTVLPRL